MKQVEQKIEEQLDKVLYQNLSRKVTTAWLQELWGLLLSSEEFKVPHDIEILSISATFKLIYPENPPIKCFYANELTWDNLNTISDSGARVPKPIGKILSTVQEKRMYWCFTEWVDGECYRDTCKTVAYLRDIPLSLWFRFGELIASIHRVETNNSASLGFCVFDIAWWNCVVDADENVWLIDPKKVALDDFPERWIYFNILFNRNISKEQKEAFIEGYLATPVLVNRSLLGIEMLETTKQFTDELHEKLAGQQRVPIDSVLH